MCVCVCMSSLRSHQVLIECRCDWVGLHSYCTAGSGFTWWAVVWRQGWAPWQLWHNLCPWYGTLRQNCPLLTLTSRTQTDWVRLWLVFFILMSEASVCALKPPRVSLVLIFHYFIQENKLLSCHVVSSFALCRAGQSGSTAQRPPLKCIRNCSQNKSAQAQSKFSCQYAKV